MVEIKKKNGRIYLGPTDKIIADGRYEDKVYQVLNSSFEGIGSGIDEHFDKYGAQRLDGMNWVAVVTEEWGETVRAYLNKNYQEVFKEAHQTMACIVRLLAECEREMIGSHVMEKDWYTRAV